MGTLVVEEAFVDTQPFSDGLAAVYVTVDDDPKSALRHRWGFIDKQGEMVIQPQYIWTEGLREGKAAVIIKLKSEPNRPPVGKWAFIDKSGKVVIEPTFYQASRFSQWTRSRSRQSV
ncbi:MAG: hypothetical protein ACI9G1_005988 [Pirellulaceae bacterium]|jgi:hypothetical protein